MTPRTILLPLLLMSAAVAQDSTPIVLEKNPICQGRQSDVPDCITAPRQIYAPDPKYPEKERKARHRGAVILSLVVGTDGLPRDIAVLRPLGPDFDQAAIDAVKKWKFSPASRDGKPIATQIKTEVTFQLY